jgi:hypothetical protein
LDKLFDHLVSEREQSRRNLDAERFRGPLNDRDLKFGGQNGQTCWLFAAQNRPATYLPISIAEARSAACQPPKTSLSDPTTDSSNSLGKFLKQAIL